MIIIDFLALLNALIATIYLFIRQDIFSNMDLSSNLIIFPIVLAFIWSGYRAIIFGLRLKLNKNISDDKIVDFIKGFFFGTKTSYIFNLFLAVAFSFLIISIRFIFNNSEQTREVVILSSVLSFFTFIFIVEAILSIIRLIISNNQHIEYKSLVSKKMKKCNFCSNDNAINATLCSSCGENLPVSKEKEKEKIISKNIKICKFCRFENHFTSLSCADCGKNLNAPDLQE
ncbi:MAG: hypothetical protein FWD48_01865 [Oscillospiraceae bacterium]|nr:hypothetical protein [Oscillospiraceae bacterium]